MKWNDCTRALPPLNTDVLGLLINDRMIVVERRGTDEKWSWSATMPLKYTLWNTEITHWTELPRGPL